MNLFNKISHNYKTADARKVAYVRALELVEYLPTAISHLPLCIANIIFQEHNLTLWLKY